MNKQSLVTLIGTIAFMLILVVYATYAYVAPTTSLSNLNINADLGSQLVFTATGGNVFDTYVSQESMNASFINNIVASASDTIVISLDTDGAEGVCCSYDIAWAWNLDSDPYTISPAATNEYVLSANMNETYTALDSTTKAIAQTNPKFSRQIPNYNASALTTTMYTGSICNNTEELNTHAEQSYNISANFYNLDVVQDSLKGTALMGQVKVTNIRCERSNT